MNFLKLLLQGIAVLPSLIQGVESLYGAGTGTQKKEAAIGLVGSALNMTDAIATKQIVDANGFTDGLGKIVDGVVACLNASIWHKA